MVSKLDEEEWIQRPEFQAFKTEFDAQKNREKTVSLSSVTDLMGYVERRI
jgi:hypothetical protein